MSIHHPETEPPNQMEAVISKMYDQMCLSQCLSVNMFIDLFHSKLYVLCT